MDELLNNQKVYGENLNVVLNTWCKTPAAKRVPSYVVGLMDDLKEKWKVYSNQHQKLLRMKVAENETKREYFVSKVFENSNMTYYEILGQMQEVLAQSPIDSSADQGHENITTLPRLIIPKFSGKYDDWRSFHDLYSASVHNKRSIPKVQKLQILKSLLEGEAEALLRHFQIIDVNYNIAWQTLTNRFDNKRVLVSTQLRKLMSQPCASETSAGIKELLDTTMQCMHALEALDVNVENWDPLLNFIVSQRLPSTTHALWEQSLSTTDLPSFVSLTEFLEKRFRALEFLNVDQVSQLSDTKKGKAEVHHVASKQCWFCDKKFHPLKKCYAFLNLNPNQRLDAVIKQKLCKKCFAYSHKANDCTFNQGCNKCNKNHNTLLHVEEKSNAVANVAAAVPCSNMCTSVNPTTISSQPSVNASVPATPSSNTSNSANVHISRDPHSVDQVLLATALVEVDSRSGPPMLLRALLDNGSQANLITEKAAKALGLSRTQSSITISGVGNTSSNQPRSVVNFSIFARTNRQVSVNINAFIMPSLTQLLPTQPIKLPVNSIEQFNLADPTYGTPSPIDLILSADVLAQIMIDEMRKLSPVGPIVQNTTLGWILSGSSAKFNEAACYNSTVHTTSFSIDETLRLFWEIENVPADKKLRDDEIKCVELFDIGHSRGSDGRYKVSLPFRNEQGVTLGSSRDAAMSRFIQLERRFNRSPEFKQQYVAAIQDYIRLGHMIKVDSAERDHATVGNDGNINYSCSYLPHHGVVKESSTTTRLRIVFDASAKSKNGASLNDCLLTGPVIQESLMTILLRWRSFPVVMKADITQMYRQIWVTDKDSEYQRILWRSNSCEEIADYRLTTVTFGVASAPFLAIKSLQQLAKDEGHRFPLAARKVLNDFYVDDLLSGAGSVEEGLELQRQIINLLRAGGFPIRKWSSNRDELLKNIDVSDREIGGSESTCSIKALGLRWSPNEDCFSFKNPVLSICDSTKRTLLSESAKLFDPLGWLAPTVIIAKMLFQRLWIAGLTWDEPLPDSLNADWQNFKNNLHCIDHIKIPRWIGTQCIEEPVQLHGFCDASEHAYAAVVYLRTRCLDGSYSVRLICAKTRVAPVKSLSIARLELCGALLLAQLIDYIKNIHQSTEQFVWTDSEIVLAWLQGHPNRWKTFVANRVSEIQSYLPSNVWRHVRSADNPADCASRGVQADLLVNHPLWWSGPAWLTEKEDSWPSNNVNLNLHIDDERKSAAVLIVRANEFLATLSDRFSSLNRLLRVTAYLKRWKLKVLDKVSVEDWLSVAEVEESAKLWVRATQVEHFSREINNLNNSIPVHPKSKLRSLLPLIDADGIVRVGGRIRNADIPYNERHPIILPNKCSFTNLLIDQVHARTLHGGTQLMLAHIRANYWVINARNTVRYRLNKCVRCYRYAHRPQSQLMADLPSPRLSVCKPFTHTGVDYAGPIEILVQRKPGRRQCTKGYICLFVCFSTKAIHLELVGDLTSNSFLAAFNRFASRRGLPSTLYSDNGTNFVAAAKQLDIDFKKSVCNVPNEVIHQVTGKGVEWKFIPPSAPHFGGLWEAGVKSTKLHLRRVLGESVLKYEEMLTVLIEIEACLNSRPLCPMTNDPSDLSALTPGHFLTGEPLLAVSRPNVLNMNVNRLDRFKLMQRLQQHFWQRWKSEYLIRLQQRPKWVSPAPNLKIGDLVLIKEDCAPPSRWALGRIIKVHPGNDGLVRVVTLKTATTTLKRPVAKLCLLPSGS